MMTVGDAQRRKARARRGKNRGKGVTETLRVWTRAEREAERRKRGWTGGA